MVALGTHPPMTEDAICHRLEITPAERHADFPAVRLLNHEWDNPAALRTLGTIPAEEIAALSGGLFAMDVEVKINARVFDYDQLIIVGPVFPHEVVGFSGGNKYLFPGIAGPEILNFFHWLGAVITNPMIIGNKWTPVRKVVDRAAKMVPIDKLCFCLVVDGHDLAGAFAGPPEAAWDAGVRSLPAASTSRIKDHPFHTILSCAPPMYDDLWTGGKCMYKLEPVLADGGELIIYAPHISEISVTHGRLIEQIGYHCRDYFLKQWDRFKDLPWGVIAHSTHVRGIGTYENERRALPRPCHPRHPHPGGNLRPHQHGLPRPRYHQPRRFRQPRARRHPPRPQSRRDALPAPRPRSMGQRLTHRLKALGWCRASSLSNWPGGPEVDIPAESPRMVSGKVP